MKMHKKHDSCKTCGHLFFGNIHYDTIHNDYYCEMNDKIVEYPREMGGKNKCPCYITKVEYKKENKRKIIENHIYPQKPEVEAI